MNDYRESYGEFDKSSKSLRKLSHECAGIPSPHGKHFYASVLFTRLCVSAVSLQSLCPNPKSLGQGSHWDYVSACTLARNIVECYLTFYYLCIQKVSEPEWEARWRLLNLHDCLQREKMFACMNIETEEEAAKVIKITIQELRENAYFKTLPAKQQQHYLKGNNALFMSQDDIVRSYGGDVDDFRLMYRFLSNQVHSFPMSFYRVGEQERGRGVESEIEIGYTALCLDTVRQYLDRAYKEYEDLFRNLRKIIV